MKTIKTGIVVGALAGLVLAIMLIAYHGFAEVSSTLLEAGWGLVAVSLFHLVPMAFSSFAWRSLLAPAGKRPPLVFFWARWVREGASHLLPVAQVGAELIGARTLTLHGLKAGIAGASVVVDLSMEVATQFLFTLLGLGLLVLAGTYDQTVRWMFLGLVIMVPALGGFVLAQRRGLFRLLEQFVEKLAGNRQWLSMGRVDGLHETIQAMYRNRRGLLVSGALHLLAWLVGAAEVWLVLYFMGHPIGLREALILESLGMAVRGAGFAVPGALGVQEGGLMLIAVMVGLSPEAGLALSLAKRVRDLLLGVPALLGWQFLEGRKAWVANGDDARKLNR